jgi:hypothetical protein
MSRVRPPSFFFFFPVAPIASHRRPGSVSARIQAGGRRRRRYVISSLPGMSMPLTPASSHLRSQASESLPSPSSSFKATLSTNTTPPSRVRHTACDVSPGLMGSIIRQRNRFLQEAMRHRRRGCPPRCPGHGRPRRIRVRIVVILAVSTSHMASLISPTLSSLSFPLQCHARAVHADR